MSIVACRVCRTEWAATVRPCCPTCLLQAWFASPDLIADKHHPENAAVVHTEYRSVVSDEVVANLRSVLEDAVLHGTWYFNTEYEKYNHVTHLPLRLKPGIGQGAGKSRPDRHLTDLVVADADRDPHLFADDRDQTRRKLATGIYLPLQVCGRARCDNLCPPRARRCALHLDPALAERSRAAGGLRSQAAPERADRGDG